MVKESFCLNAGDVGSIPGLGRPLEKGMATHSSIPAWEIPWTEESGGLQLMGLQIVRHYLGTKQQLCAKCFVRGKETLNMSAL